VTDVETLPLFDADPTPPPDRFAGLGADAARTLRQHDRMVAGWHPVTGTPLHPAAPPVDDRAAAGPRCGSCAKMWQKYAGGGGPWWKCTVVAGDHEYGPDMRRWWPACTLYEAAP
jgi:hypothetical protein